MGRRPIETIEQGENKSNTSDLKSQILPEKDGLIMITKINLTVRKMIDFYK